MEDDVEMWKTERRTGVCACVDVFAGGIYN